MSAFGGKADIIRYRSKGPLIAIGGSFVGQGQHEISHQMVAKDTLFSLPGHLIRIVTSWSLSEELGKND